MLSDGHATYTPGLSENRGGTSSFYENDQLGNLWTIDPASGSGYTAGYLTSGFGAGVLVSGSSATVFKFGGGNGCQSDADTGLVLMGHRYYDSRVGRFITQDPAGEGDNWYAYAGNSPTNEVDPDGLAPMDGPGSSPVGSPGYSDGAASGSAGAMEEYGLNWQRHSYIKYSYNTPSTQYDTIGYYWTPSVDVGDWVDQNVTFGLVSASGRDWDSHPAKARWELAGASVLVVGTAVSIARVGLSSLIKSGCFTARTPVQTEQGAKPIQSLHVGDLVATRSLETGKTEYRKVVRTFKHLAQDTVTVEFADAKTGQVVDTVTGTPEHPFYVAGRGMAALGSLGIGTLVVTRAGPSVVVHSLVRHTSAAGVAVYNIEVEGDHTYFVGNASGGEWVHNDCGIYDILLASGKRYVGQSGDISRRLAQHIASGKITAAEASQAVRTLVPGGKTMREIAEQQLIDSYGGIRGGNLENVVNPIGQARIGLMGPGYTRP